jgi:hypothetical protein
MYTVVVQFEDILHVHRNESNRTTPRHTVFSFMSDFKYTPYVSVPGFPRLEKGMRVVALLRNENDWKSLVGWRDLDTGAIAAPDPSFHVRRLVFFSLWVVVFFYFMLKDAARPSHSALWLGLPLAIGGVFLWLEFRDWRRARAEFKELEGLPREA